MVSASTVTAASKVTGATSAAVGAFAINVQFLNDNSRLADALVPAVASLVALPLGVAAETPLRAWRLQMILAAAMPLITPPQSTQGPRGLPRWSSSPSTCSGRIARELHDIVDIVAHHMSVIAVRTETAPFRLPELPQAARDDMAETSAIAREALTEMRRLLGVLRGADTGAERAPQRGIDRLDGLITAVRGAGLTVDLQVVGVERPLPPGVELSAYWIVQEALSSTLRHAPGAPASVEVGYEPACLRLRIRNGAPTARVDRPRPASPGQGTVGMRERATMLGGSLAAGPASEGGHLVEAVLPPS